MTNLLSTGPCEFAVYLIMRRPVFFVIALLLSLQSMAQPQPLAVSKSGRYFITADGKPFFWLGDTGWLLFVKCTREEAIKYLDTRKAQGFNMIQVMVLHDLKNTVNVYGDSAFINKDVSQPKMTDGNAIASEEEYDYWDHVSFIIDEAAKRNMYIGMVAVWGSNVKAKLITKQQAEGYAVFLAGRFKNKTNIVWINGGDLKGDVEMEIWNTIGESLHKEDPHHLQSFHPRGRYSSSVWFHDKDWLDFNMVQSGHKDYAQDTTASDQFHFGEDNWRFINQDYQRQPVKPTLDAEPSYENIPHGLHDSLQIRWTDADIRRYAYWSVFAGGAGFTYGENAVMQFRKAPEPKGAYGVTTTWEQGILSKGATQMQFLKKLMLSKDLLSGKPDQSLFYDQGVRYNYLVAFSGTNYAFVYTYNGRSITTKLGTLSGNRIMCSWYDPRTGQYQVIGTFANKGKQTFDPPGKKQNGNDWVLVMESVQ